MKTLLMICCASLGLAAGAAYGQYVLPGSPPPTTSTSGQQVSQSKQFYHSRDLVGAKVKDVQGQKLGSINDIVLNPKSGEILAAIDIGHGENALVPLRSLSLAPGTGMLRSMEATLNKSKADLASSPRLTKDQWGKLDDPNFTRSVYSYYNVQAPSSAMGGTSDESTRDVGKQSR